MVSVAHLIFATRALAALYLSCLKARGRRKHCIYNVRGLAGAGSIVFVVSEGSRALGALYL